MQTKSICQLLLRIAAGTQVLLYAIAKRLNVRMYSVTHMDTSQRIVCPGRD